MRAGLCVGVIACALAACGGDDTNATADIDAGGGGGDTGTGSDSGGGAADGDGGGGSSDAGGSDAGPQTDAGGGTADGGNAGGIAQMRVVNLGRQASGTPPVADVVLGDRALATDLAAGQGSFEYMQVASGRAQLALYAGADAAPGAATDTVDVDLVPGHAYIAVVALLDGQPELFAFDATGAALSENQTSLQIVNANSDFPSVEVSNVRTLDNIEAWSTVGSQTAGTAFALNAGDYRIGLNTDTTPLTPEALYLLNLPAGFDVRLYATSDAATPTLWFEAVAGQLVPMIPLPE